MSKKEKQTVAAADVGSIDLIMPGIAGAANETPLGECSLDQELVKCPSSLDLNCPQGFAMAFNAIGTSDRSVGDMQCCEVNVEHWLLHPSEAEDEKTGEIKRFLRLVLIDEFGTTFATTGPVVMMRLALLIQRFGRGPWMPPLRLVVIGRKTGRSKGTYHDLRLRISGEHEASQERKHD